MTRGRGWRLAAAVSLAAAASGCGLGSGPASPGEATLAVTRNYGSERLLEATDEDPPESETVIRLLDREAEIETRYGGGFVQEIEGLSGTVEGGRRYDWFFYVNGIESPVGAAEAEVRGGDRIWWDYRDWTEAMRVPAVVGSWPEPFLNGAEGRPIEVECRARGRSCMRAIERLEGEGVEVAEDHVARSGPRVLVGPWRALRRDPAARQIEDGPAASGVFADFVRARHGFRMEALDERGEKVASFPGFGLVAALRRGEDPPTWVVTGTDQRAVGFAVSALAARLLRDRYAVVAGSGGNAISLPLYR